MIKGLEQEKRKYSITPRKSMSFSIENKENNTYTPNESFSYPNNQDRTFRMDHLKDAHMSARSKIRPRRSVDTFRDLDDNPSHRTSNTMTVRPDRPPTIKAAHQIQSN